MNGKQNQVTEQTHARARTHAHTHTHTHTEQSETFQKQSNPFKSERSEKLKKCKCQILQYFKLCEWSMSFSARPLMCIHASLSETNAPATCLLWNYFLLWILTDWRVLQAKTDAAPQTSVSSGHLHVHPFTFNWWTTPQPESLSPASPHRWTHPQIIHTRKSQPQLSAPQSQWKNGWKKGERWNGGGGLSISPLLQSGGLQPEEK